MNKPTLHDAETAEAQGRERGLAGGDLSENPHSMAQGSSVRVLGIAWRRGFYAGREVRDASPEPQA